MNFFFPSFFFFSLARSLVRFRRDSFPHQPTHGPLEGGTLPLHRADLVLRGTRNVMKVNFAIEDVKIPDQAENALGLEFFEMYRCSPYPCIIHPLVAKTVAGGAPPIRV